MNIVFTQKDCINTGTALRKEWIDTNGLGGYASSTIINCHTRKYHGLLVASLKEPKGRHVLLSKVEADVGRAKLYLLDSDIDRNSRKDREITDKLYDAGTRERIEQEILLGMGGVQFLRKLSIEPPVYHLNEGHSAFMLIQRIRYLMEETGIDLDAAKEAVKSRMVFTTHTPMPAGNEQFERSLIENYFKQYVQQMGISLEQLWNLGHVYGGDESPFDMTLFAIKLSHKSNGVRRSDAAMWCHRQGAATPQMCCRGTARREASNGSHFGVRPP